MGTRTVRSRHCDLDSPAEPRLSVTVPAEVAAVLRTLTLIDASTERLVFAAAIDDDHGVVLLVGTGDDFDELIDHIAAEANHTTNRRHQKRLDTAFDTLRHRSPTATD